MHRLARVARHIQPFTRVDPHLCHARSLMSAPAAAAAAASVVAAHAPCRLKVACVQMTSGDDMEANIRSCSDLVRQAAAQGARLVCTPENTARMSAFTQKQAAAAPMASGNDSGSGAVAASAPRAAAAPAPAFVGHPVLTALSALAAELNVWILVGSIAVRPDDDPFADAAATAADKRFSNRSVLLAPTPKLTHSQAQAAELTSAAAAGPSSSSAAALTSAAPLPSQVVAHYDKIFLFDVPSLNGSESYLESARVRSGSEAVVADCSSSVAEGGLGAGVAIGMSVCYDLRFPQLYRSLAQAGASILAVPAAFTVVTGQAHWHALLRARAIETGSFVIAPAQVGTHPGDRRTYGHSLIVDPWGTIVADAGGDSTGIIVAELDLALVAQARNRIPSLLHDRPFVVSKKQIE